MTVARRALALTLLAPICLLLGCCLVGALVLGCLATLVSDVGEGR